MPTLGMQVGRQRWAADGTRAIRHLPEGWTPGLTEPRCPRRPSSLTSLDRHLPDRTEVTARAGGLALGRGRPLPCRLGAGSSPTAAQRQAPSGTSQLHGAGWLGPAPREPAAPPPPADVSRKWGGRAGPESGTRGHRGAGDGALPAPAHVCVRTCGGWCEGESHMCTPAHAVADPLAERCGNHGLGSSSLVTVDPETLQGPRAGGDLRPPWPPSLPSAPALLSHTRLALAFSVPLGLSSEAALTDAPTGRDLTDPLPHMCLLMSGVSGWGLAGLCWKASPRVSGIRLHVTWAHGAREGSPQETALTVGLR